MDLHAALEQYFHYPQFRPGQEIALRHVLQQQDALVVMPTGAGKSLIYQLSALLMDGTAIVFSPLIALMKDQVDGMNRRGIPATFINSSLSPDEQSQRQRGMVQGKYKLVLIAPERLRSPNFRAALASVQISMLVLDEAHCLSQWGHDFRPDYMNIAALRPQLQPKVTLALTATATPRTQVSIVDQLGMPEAQRFINGFNRSNLYFEVLPAASNTDKLKRVREYMREHGNEGGIIYAGTRANAEEVAAFVRDTCGLKAQHYHGAMEANARAQVQDLFMAGDLPIVVATNAFGMGIDRPDVRFVLHHTMPGSLEAYYQEAGRAGRDGLPARATLLQSAQDIVLHEHFIKNDAPTADELRRIHGILQVDMPPTDSEIAQRLKVSDTKARVAIGLLSSAQGKLDDAAVSQIIQQVDQRREHKRSLLRTMIQYAQTDECRRAKILEYFGDSGDAAAAVCCDNCDEIASLKQPTEMRPAETRTERAALIVMDTIALMAQRNSGVGKGKLALILKGSQSEDVKYFTQNRNFGKFHELPVKEIESLISQLLNAGYLKQAGDERPVLQLTQRGDMILKARAAVNVKLRAPSERDADGAETTPVKRPRTEGNTIEVTRRLLDEGKTVEQIAAERQLTPGTIYTHCSSLIADGVLQIDRVLDSAHQMAIRAAINTVGSANALAPIKAILPDYISYNEIRCMTEAWKREHGQGATITTISSPPALADDPIASATTFERLRKWRLERAKTDSVPPYVVFSDEALHGIVNANPRLLEDLLSVRGVGQVKMERYGAEVLKVLQDA